DREPAEDYANEVPPLHAAEAALWGDRRGMKVICQSCSADYNIDERKIPPTGAFVTCKKCKTKIRLAPPKTGAPATSAVLPLGGSQPAAPPNKVIPLVVAHLLPHRTR